MAELSIGVPILVGVAFGALEAFFVYEDEAITNVRQAFGDMIHGFIFAALGTLFACNVPFFLSMLPIPGFIENLLFINEDGNSVVIAIIIAIFMFLKMVVSKAIKGVSSDGFTEKFWHKILISLGVGFSGFLVLPLTDYLTQFVPSWIPL